MKYLKVKPYPTAFRTSTTSVGCIYEITRKQTYTAGTYYLIENNDKQNTITLDPSTLEKYFVPLPE